MKVVFCTGYYDNYLQYFYNKNAGLDEKPYESQMEAILDDCFVSWGGLTRYFKQLDADNCLLIPNCRELQTAWAKENNVGFNEDDWQFSIPIQQIKKLRPDILYLGSMFDYYGEFMDEVRNYTKNVFGWISCVIPSGTKYHKLDLILSSLPSLVEKFKREGINSEYLNSSFDASILNKLAQPLKQDIDFSFIGSITGHHQNRIYFIKELLSKTSLQLFARNVKALNNGNILQRTLSKNKYTRRNKGDVYGLDMYNILQRSKITFNKHIDMSNEYIGNARMFEATGAGTLLLTDGLSSPNKVFKDDEVVYYDTVDEAIEKLNYYLQHEEERIKIAKKGQERTLREYNCEVTGKRMQNYFQKYMK